MPSMMARQLMVIGLSVLGAASPAREQGPVPIFVDDDAPPAGDGGSWDTAFRFLQDALIFASDKANGVSDIRVAQGTYLPDHDEANPNGTGDREVSFDLIDGVALIGGYAGIGAKDPDARDFELFETILSGNIGDAGNSSDNSEHVLRGVALVDPKNTVLDGFVVTSGFTGFVRPSDGAGLLLNDSVIAIANTTFTDNRASRFGGAIFLQDSDVLVTNCQIIGNRTDEIGGGIYSQGSTLTLTDSLLTSNLAFPDIKKGIGGGGIGLAGGAAIISNCTFLDNFTIGDGGAIFDPGGSAQLTDCQFVANFASDGYGGAVRGGATFTNCFFSGNDASSCCFGEGGALYGAGQIVKCTFEGNSATFIGGGVASSGSVTDSVFTGNSADAGGGIGNVGSITNCTFSDNAAFLIGGDGVWNSQGTTLTGCHFLAGDTFLNHGGSAAVNSCTFEGGDGIINSKGSSLLVVNSLFTSGFNGLVNDFGSEAVIESCIFQDNGTGIFNDSSSSATITDSTFTANGAGIFSTGTIRGGGVGGFDDTLSLGQLLPGLAPPKSQFGTFTIDGPFSQFDPSDPLADTGTIVIEIGGTNPGLDHDVINFPGGLPGDGKLFVELVDNFQPKLGDSFVIGSYSGSLSLFSLYDSTPIPGDLFLRLTYPPNGPAAGGGGFIVVTVESIGEFLGFGDPQFFGAGGLPTSLAKGDFDGQNGIDLAVTVPALEPTDPGEVFIFLNNGTDGNGGWLGFGTVLQISVGIEPSSVTVADFDLINGDDLAVANAGDNDVTILLNDGGGGDVTFDRTDFPVGTEPRSIAAADIDGQNGDDLAVVNTADATVSILINDGNGSFNQPGEPMGAGLLPIDVDPADLDNDKDVDLVSLTMIVVIIDDEPVEVPSISVRLNLDGQGTFGDEVFYGIGGESNNIVIGDLNNDTFVDVIATNITEGSIAILLNAGDQTFQGAVSQPLSGVPSSIVASDLDNDNDLDLAAVVDIGGPLRIVQVLENLIDGGVQLSFAEPTSPPTEGNPVLITAVDLDNDTFDDLITLNESEEGIPTGGNGPMGDLVGIHLNNGQLGDLNGDGHVGAADLIILLACFGIPPEDCANPNADINGDGFVNAIDLTLLLVNWGR